MEPQRDEDFFYVVDDDGNAIEPAAEGSCLMAEGLLEMARAETGEDFIVAEPYVPDFDVGAAQARARAFLDATAARREAEAREAGEAQGDEERNEERGEEASQEEAGDLGEDGEEEDEEGGAFPVMGSRDLTDPDDWRLEAIVKRRVNKEREGGLWVYLCKWAGHAEPTWETREVMEDAGWIPQLDAYDNKGAFKRKVKPYRVKTPPPVKMSADDKNATTVLDYFGGEEGLIPKLNIAFRSLNGSVLRFCSLNNEYATRFLARWEQQADTHVPTIVYHGTRPSNFENIFKLGLVVGGTNGVIVANGSAYGAGVYTATSPILPACYNYGSNTVIVCVGLVPTDVSHPSAFQTNGCIIFRDAMDVFPMWLVQYASPTYPVENAPLRIDFTEFNERANHLGFQWNPPPPPPPPPQPPLAALPVIAPSKTSSAHNEPLTESENREVSRAMATIKDSHGGVRTNVLKGQPRRIRELLAKAATERRRYK